MEKHHQVTPVTHFPDIVEFARRDGCKLDEHNGTFCFKKHDLDQRTLQFDSATHSFYCTKRSCRFHGNIIDYVRITRGVDFSGAVRLITEMTGFDLSPQLPQDDLANYVRVCDCLQEAARFYALNLDSAIPFLNGRGISPATAERHLVGCTRGKDSLKRHLRGQGFTTEEIGLAGLLNKYGDDFFRDRFIVPTRICGQVVSFYGRGLDKDAEMRHLRMPNDRLIIGRAPFNWNPDREEFIVTEAPLDALALIDRGFTSTIATLGTQGLASPQSGDLLKGSSVKRVYLCYDGDAAGRKATVKDSYALEDLGLDVRVVDIGDQDPNEYVQQHTPEDFQSRLDGSTPPVQWQIDHLDPDLSPEEKIKALEPLFTRCDKMEPLMRSATIDRIARAVGFPKKQVERHIEALADTRVEEAPILDLGQLTCVHPALDYVQGITLVQIPQLQPNPKTGRPQWIPYMVNSKREFFPLEPEELQQRGFYVESSVVPAPRRYSPEAIADFLAGRREGDIKRVFPRIVRILRHYLDSEDSRTFVYLAAWITGTYFFPMFNYYPYIHFTGTKNVGKSKTMSLIACLAFNAVMSTSMSAASLFRAVDGWRSTVLMDETEYLHQKEFSDKRLIMNGGFQKGSFVTRTEKEGDTYHVKQFHNYCPKVFASIEDLDDTLSSRTVQIFMHRSDNDVIKEREVALNDPVYQDFRDELLLAGLCQAPAVEALYDTLDKPTDVQFGDREFNLFKPILTIGLATTDDKVVEALIGFANASYVQKRTHQNDTSEENVVLRYLLEAVPKDDWYRSDTLHSGFVKFIKTNGLDIGRAMNKSRMGKLLRKLKVVEKDDRASDRSTTVYLIKRKNLEGVAANYQVMWVSEPTEVLRI